MEEIRNIRPVVRNLQNNIAYEYMGGNRYKNLITGVEGEVPEEKAKEVFVFNVEATNLFNDYPMVEELMRRLKLRLEKSRP